MTNRVHVSQNNVVSHCITKLRNRATDAESFRLTTKILGRYLVADAVADVGLSAVAVETPLEQTEGVVMAEPVVLIPILRAGLGMLEAGLDMLPHTTVGYLGFERDEETAKARAYYAKMPSLKRRTVLLLDPMLATGGTAVQAIDAVKREGAREVKLISILAAPEGIEAVHRKHPDVSIHLAVIDRELDGNKYIRPGLGDYGDRLYGTD